MGRNKINGIVSYAVLKNSQMDIKNQGKYFQLNFPNTLINLYQWPYAKMGNLNRKHQYSFVRRAKRNCSCLKALEKRILTIVGLAKSQDKS